MGKFIRGCCIYFAVARSQYRHHRKNEIPQHGPLSSCPCMNATCPTELHLTPSPYTVVDAADYGMDGTLAVHDNRRASSVTEMDITRGCAEPGTPDLLTP